MLGLCCGTQASLVVALAAPRPERAQFLTSAPASEDGFFTPEPAEKSQRGLGVTLCSCIPNPSKSSRPSLPSESHGKDPVLAYFIEPRDFWNPSEKQTSTQKRSCLLQEMRHCLQPDHGPHPDREVAELTVQCTPAGGHFLWTATPARLSGQ